MRLLSVLCAVSVSLSVCGGARVLSIMPLPARSHHGLFDALLTTLARRGHQVVSYTTFPPATPVDNYSVVHVNLSLAMDNLMTLAKLNEMMSHSPVASLVSMWDDVPKFLQVFLNNEKVMKLFHSEETYDLVILEPLICQEIFLGLGHKFNAPVISVQPFGAFSLAHAVAGNSLSLSYIPDFTFPYSDHMSMYERALSAYSKLKTLYIYYSRHLPAQETLMRELYNDPTMPPLVDLVHNISLFVNNAHPYVTYPQPYTPNMVQVGGIHLQTATHPLPDDISQFMDGAKEGVIFFSLGSIVPDHTMPPEYFNNFLQAFRRLPQRVVWKTKARLSGLPDNVMTVQWAPQQDILAHPRMALFVTHGGLFSQHEAVNAGVPVVCVPFFADQPGNARLYVERGVGIELPFNSLSEDTIYTAITEVLYTPKYKGNMRRLSAIYRDRPVSPADSLVFWVEYVLRHRGAHHLRPASAAMAWYQLALLDVIGTLGTILLIALILLFFIIIKISTLFKNKSQTMPIGNKKIQ